MKSAKHLFSMMWKNIGKKTHIQIRGIVSRMAETSDMYGTAITSTLSTHTHTQGLNEAEPHCQQTAATHIITNYSFMRELFLSFSKFRFVLHELLFELAHSAILFVKRKGAM